MGSAADFETHGAHARPTHQLPHRLRDNHLQSMYSHSPCVRDQRIASLDDARLPFAR